MVVWPPVTGVAVEEPLLGVLVAAGVELELQAARTPAAMITAAAAVRVRREPGLCPVLMCPVLMCAVLVCAVMGDLLGGGWDCRMPRKIDRMSVWCQWAETPRNLADTKQIRFE